MADNLNFSGTTLTGITTIHADLGNDTVVGSAAADTIVGGAGRDTMTGGLGNDIFDFNLLSESGIGTPLRDIITDFVRGFDKIDLSTIDPSAVTGDQTFVFIGNAGFGAGATNQVRIDTVTVPGFTSILVDTDDAGAVANMEILLTGTPSVTGGDFIL